jgi:hypothetical protein
MLLRNKLLTFKSKTFKLPQLLKSTALKFSTNTGAGHDLAEGVALQSRFDTITSEAERVDFQQNLTEEQKNQMKRFDLYRFDP